MQSFPQHVQPGRILSWSRILVDRRLFLLGFLLHFMRTESSGTVVALRAVATCFKVGVSKTAESPVGTSLFVLSDDVRPFFVEPSWGNLYVFSIVFHKCPSYGGLFNLRCHKDMIERISVIQDAAASLTVSGAEHQCPSASAAGTATWRSSVKQHQCQVGVSILLETLPAHASSVN